MIHPHSHEKLAIGPGAPVGRVFMQMGRIVRILFLLFALGEFEAAAADTPLLSKSTADVAKKTIWVNGIGSGYREDARMLDLTFTRGFGATNYGGEVARDLLLVRMTFSQSINEVWSPDSWYGGNLLFTGEIMGGIQDRPDTAYLIFANAGLRYEFATKGRFIPFVHLGVGSGATGIGAPDLSEGLQFNEQGGVGVRYYFNEQLSATLGASFMHISNGGLRKPNGGVNTYMLSFGVGWAL